ncbi:MAG: hypothetical protein E6998_06380 [Kluyvera ascorbata]|nr:hypothetical protein [Kluyvera ascorbata]MDU1195669.1 hypothetical protein [Kluyvera ascorbata]
MSNRLTDDELQQLIWGLKRYALHPRTLTGLQELQERRKADTQPIAFITEITSISGGIPSGRIEFTRMLDREEHGLMLYSSSPEPAKELLTITLPDVSSKAFWSATGKHEVFHPETYKRWVKEAIERDCTIANIEVKVK